MSDNTMNIFSTRFSLAGIAESIDAQSRREHAEVVAWRRHMHRHPELSFKEVDTANFLERELAAIDGLEVSRPTPTSLLARLAGGRKGRTLAMRADIDALPLQDQKSCDYASGNPNVMHACGHDGHAAMLLGSARILAGLRSQVPGEVRFFFQHAEEQHPGGAQQMVDAGVIKGVDQVISAHVLSTLDTGSIAVLDGPALASSDRFVLRVRGRGGHAANPDRSIDPIMIGAQIVCNLQAVVSRNADPHEAVILSVTRFDGGTAFNVIPDTVELWGSVRCFNERVRELVPALVERIANGVAGAHGASCDLDYIRGYSPVVNDPAVAERMRAVVEQGIATAALQPIRPLPNSEDFSAFLKHAPGVYVFIGARSAAKGIVHPHHHPHFDFDEDALLHGVQLFANAPFHLNA